MPDYRQKGPAKDRPPDPGIIQKGNIQNIEIVHISDEEMINSDKNVDISNNSEQPGIISNDNLNQQLATNQNIIQLNESTSADRQNLKTIPERIKNLNTDNRFSSHSTGPYFMFVEHKYLNIGRIHPMRLGEKLLQIGEDEKHIIEINNIGRNRIKIQVDSAAAANKLVSNSVFEKNDLVAYIPTHLTEKKGVIRGIDTSYSENELLNLIQSSVPVKAIKRMFRRNNQNNERVPRQMVVITFKGLEIPQFIYINKIRFPVDVYYSPVLMCYNCLRYGHTSTLCRGNKKCSNCSEEISNNLECNNCKKFCFYCQSENHSTTDRSCPAYLKQKRTKQAMAHLNISFSEAEKVVDSPSYASLTSLNTQNRFAPLMNSDSDFPPLVPKNHHNSPRRTQQYSSNYGMNDNNQSNSPKKRKANSPPPTPIHQSREFPFSFCNKPVINHNTFPLASSYEELKNKIFQNLNKNMNQFWNTDNTPEIQHALKVINFDQIIATLFETLNNYIQQST